MTREEAIQRFNGIINAMSISIAQSKFYPSKAELDELCDMAIESLSAEPIERISDNTIVVKYADYENIGRIILTNGDIFCKMFYEDARQNDDSDYDSLVPDEYKTDAVAVVRCKDCRQYIPHDLTDDYGWCCEFKTPIEEDDFCSHGERKGE